MTHPLKNLLNKTPILEVLGGVDKIISSIVIDSRKAEKNCLFVAIKGTQKDGHQYINEVVEKGCSVVVAEDFSIVKSFSETVAYIKVHDSEEALANLSANYYDNPANHLKIIGITGTNGKTTTATLLYQLFRELGYGTGLISTVCIKINDNELPTNHTTPDALELHGLFKKMYDSRVEYCFMEVSSHALEQKRVWGVPFAGAVFTNLTHDHLDYHGDFAHYLKAKQKLFDALSPNAFSITNIDDKNGRIMVQNSKAKIKTFGLKTIADYRAKMIENRLDGLLLEIAGNEVWFRLSGGFNAYNLLGVYASAMELGQDSEKVLVALSNLKGAKGRFEVVDLQDNIKGIIDYAHTPDALKNVLENVQTLRNGQGRLIVIFGCGGNRDNEKRPIMGKIASETADLVVVTSDNPRNENPTSIINEILAGIPISLKKKVLTIENRREAINAVAKMAQKDDIIVIAGKGHENYQLINKKRYHFDDREELIKAFAVEI